MSQEKIEIVKRAITAINERDIDAYLALCTPDFEMINPFAAIEGSNKGEQGVRAFFDGIREGTTKLELEIERLEALDNDRVLAWLTMDIESKGGFPLSQPLTNLYELKDSKLLRVRVFVDREEALKAAGLTD